MNARCDQIDFIALGVEECPNSPCKECKQFINCSIAIKVMHYFTPIHVPKSFLMMIYSEGENV